jgi:glycosyltransferase involved in cell wall biosynthesis
MLAEKLKALVKNEKLRKKMGEWGRIEAKKYAWPRVARQVLDFYEFCRKEKEKRSKR